MRDERPSSKSDGRVDQQELTLTLIGRPKSSLLFSVESRAISSMQGTAGASFNEFTSFADCQYAAAIPSLQNPHS